MFQGWVLIELSYASITCTVGVNAMGNKRQDSYGIIVAIDNFESESQSGLDSNYQSNEKPNGGVTHGCDEPIKESL